MATDEPLMSTAGLAQGDVVQYSIRLIGREDGTPYWMTRFAAITRVIGTRSLEVLTLMLHPDPRYEPRRLYLQQDDTIVTFLPPERWPPGVVAMRLKHIMTGAIKLYEG